MKKFFVYYSLKGITDTCKLLAHSAKEAEAIARRHLPQGTRVSVVMWQQ